MPTSAQIRALFALSLLPGALAAQVLIPSLRCAGGAIATALPGGIVDENSRASSIRIGRPWSLARRATDEAKVRLRGDSASDVPVRLAAVLPELLVTSQQSFPLPANDGPLWAGRGLSYSVSGGFAICGKRARWGAIIAPTYWYAENADFDLPDNPQIVPPFRGGYSPWASRYYYLPRSLDAPRRFGPTALRTVEPGVLTVFGRANRVEFGFTTEPEWWGPGQNNALLLSTQAAGLPRAFVRTTKPFLIGGELDATWFIGGMSYSRFFFENNPIDTSRSIAGLHVVWRPRVEPNLSIGIARIVIAPMAGKAYLKHLVDPLLSVGTPNAVGRGDSTQFPGRDQLFSVFANWRLPDDGAEIWAEWARADEPENLRDFFEAPNQSQAFTIGLQRVSPLVWGNWSWRVGAEYTQTNQSSTYRERPTGSWYTSRAVQAGFSQRGQVIGAAIGPGSVTQRLGLDFAHPRGSIGAFVYRTKWDDDSFFTIPRPNGNGLCKHDVSLAWGVRGSARTAAGWLEGTVTSQNRLNLYWQALGLCFENEELQIDRRNLSIEFRFRPRVR
jgi:Capsule assembly protein Wzi